MTRAARDTFFTAVFLFASVATSAQERIESWPAPALWSPDKRALSKGDVSPEGAEAVEGVPTPPLHFVALNPCRLVDTRGNGFTGQYGPPALVAGSPRNFVLTGQCGISPTAQAVSLNVTVTNTQGPGFILIYPQGGVQPSASTLNYVAAQTVANAAVVPLGAGGGITVVAGASGADLILDTNGDYRAGIVTSVTPGTGLTGGGTGAVSLGIAAGGVTSTELGTGAVTSGKIGANAVTAGAIASGQVVKDINGLRDSVTLVGSGGTTVTPGAGTITITGGGGAPSGSFLLGNPGDATLIGAGFSETGFRQDFWKATTTAGAPTARVGQTAVWTGTRMIVWGGNDALNAFNTGGRYDPVTDSWSATTTTNAPAARSVHVAVWTGSRMIVWGGADSNDTVLNTGGRYDPVADSWAATTTTGAPSARSFPAAVWTGSKMTVWGGFDGSNYVNTGSQYDPIGNSWTATTTTGAPSPRGAHTAVWTGSKMIVWGGQTNDGSVLNTGAEYDPVGNSWAATSTAGAPGGRALHTAVWTGSRMVVWGGGNSDTTNSFNTGGQYDPVGNAWTATTLAGAPTGRFRHTAVWTGSRMIVWGGHATSVGSAVSTGSQYDPVADFWSPTTGSGAPVPRVTPTAVWTGSRMIVWGGSDGAADFFNTGGQYYILSLYVKN